MTVFTFSRTIAFGTGTQSGEGGQLVEGWGSGLKSPDAQPFLTSAGSSKSLKVKNVRMP